MMSRCGAPNQHQPRLRAKPAIRTAAPSGHGDVRRQSSPRTRPRERERATDEPRASSRPDSPSLALTHARPRCANHANGAPSDGIGPVGVGHPDRESRDSGLCQPDLCARSIASTSGDIAATGLEAERDEKPGAPREPPPPGLRPDRDRHRQRQLPRLRRRPRDHSRFRRPLADRQRDRRERRGAERRPF